MKWQTLWEQDQMSIDAIGPASRLVRTKILIKTWGWLTRTSGLTVPTVKSD